MAEHAIKDFVREMTQLAFVIPFDIQMDILKAVLGRRNARRSVRH